MKGGSTMGCGGGITAALSSITNAANILKKMKK